MKERSEQRVWGTTRHGTPSGWSRHKDLGERPCPACFYAKKEYDAKRRAATPNQIRNRKHAKAQYLAVKRLMNAHRDEYRQYYAEEKAKLDESD
jgi:hypothetical protein